MFPQSTEYVKKWTSIRLGKLGAFLGFAPKFILKIQMVLQNYVIFFHSEAHGEFNKS